MTIRTKPKRSNEEAKIQRAVFDHIRSRAADGVFAFHVPNGGRRNLINGANLKAMGMTAGVPDVIAVHKGQTFAIELKAKAGRPSEKQLETIARLNDAGAFTAICYSLDAALRVLEAWGLLKGKSA